MKIKLRLRVSYDAIPAELTVRNFDGTLIFYKKFIKPCDIYSFFTCKRNIAITVRPYSDEYRQTTKYLILPETKCVCINLFLPFIKIGRTEQIFALTDANYGFPVREAMMYFNSVY